MTNNPLGKQTEYLTHYAPELLFSIARAESRKALGIAQSLPFWGCDVWTSFEVSWLNQVGKPIVAVAQFTIPCDSEFIIESKSFKLYLNSFNQTRFEHIDQVKKRMEQDLSTTAGALVSVFLYPLGTDTYLNAISNIKGICVDDIEVDEIIHYVPEPRLLKLVADQYVDETLYSNLLKTNCPVTGQPDWATLVVQYRGKKIDPESLLRFVISYREHQDFHEHSVESIFMAINEHCQPETLTVYARYTRRGGLDINPYRSTIEGLEPTMERLIRQ